MMPEERAGREGGEVGGSPSRSSYSVTRALVKRPLDLVVIFVLVAGALWALGATGFEAGSRAVVYVANEKYGWYDLSGPARETAIETKIGVVKIVTGEGMARIAASPCPGKLCVRHGAIRHGREQLVCLPARVMIVVEGGPAARGGGVDAVTQ